jgi:hypothetical protein
MFKGALDRVISKTVEPTPKDQTITRTDR